MTDMIPPNDPSACVDVPNQDLLSPLSKREKEVFYLLCEGLPNRVIAKKIFISPRTVETHRARILKKLNIDGGVIRMLRWAIRNKIIEA